MAWELSIGPNGWAELRRAVTRMSPEALAKALGDYNHDRFHGYSHWLKPDPHWRGAWNWKKLVKLPHDILADAVMEAIEFHKTCENGGNPVYIDLQGFHTVDMDEGILECTDDDCAERCTGDDDEEAWQYGHDMETLCPEHAHEAYKRQLAHA